MITEPIDNDERFIVEVLEVEVTGSIEEGNRIEKEMESHEYPYAFYHEALRIVATLTIPYWVDENRVELAREEQCTYFVPSGTRLFHIKIRENV